MARGGSRSRGKRRIRSFGIGALAIGLLAILGVGAGAVPIALDELPKDEILLSPDGSLAYSDFVVYTNGIDISLLSLEVDAQGLRLIGPVSVSGSALSDLQLSYRVSVTQDGAFLSSVGLMTQSSIVDNDFPTFVKVLKRIFDDAGTPLTTLASRNFDGEELTGGSTGFAPLTAIRVLDDLTLGSGGAGSSATLESVRNQLLAIPEPGSLTLVLAGVLGLGWAGRRRLRA